MRSSFTRNRVGLFLVVCGVLCAVVAAWLIYPPAGVGVLAVALMCAGYVVLYLEAQNASDRQSAASD